MSVVVPTYNSGPFVAEAVASVLAQTLPPAEVIVVDDGSTDDTAARLAGFGGRVRTVRQPNLGVSAARNRGLAEAGGELVAFLDADDVWHPRKLELQVRVLSARPHVGLLGTHIYDWPTDRLPSSDAVAGGRTQVVPWDRLLAWNVLVTSSVVVRRSVLDTIGGFDTGLHGPEDHDLWIRAAEVTAVGQLAAPLTGYRDVPASLSKQARRMEEGMTRIVDKLTARGALRGRPLLRRMAYSVVCHRVAYIYGQAGDHRTAVGRSLRSLAWYPLPYRGLGTAGRFERPRRLVAGLLKAAGRP